MDELVHFVKKLEEQDEENKMPNIPRSTPKGNNVGKHNNSGGAKNGKVATESPSVIVNINPSDYLERINRRKMIFAERQTNDNAILKAEVKKKDLEIQRRKSENNELKEKLKIFAERHDEEKKMLEKSYKEKAVGSPIVIAGEIESIFDHNNKNNNVEDNKVILGGGGIKHTKIKGSYGKKSKSGGSFLGLNCCGGER